MLFNSQQFAIFLPLVVALYFALPQRLRWMLLLAASYYFYMCWKPAYALLIVTTTLIDYVCALRIEAAQSPGRRKAFLMLSLAFNFGLLFTFKYFNLFSTTVNDLLGLDGTAYAMPLMDVLLPVGISFYTFQEVSYTVDVYHGVRKAERHLGIFATFVTFFPQLVAGPIERSHRLIPQFYEQHRFDPARIEAGLKLLLWGFFKKLVIADRLGYYVDQVYGASDAFDGGRLTLATYLFAFQIYCDFSGYSDIAIGSAQMLGYRLCDNFRRPYLARNIREFWSRWHMSLTAWFRDYVYVPLGGNRCSTLRWQVNILMVFLISGIWHGANWTFVVWGALHGAYYLIYTGVSTYLTPWSERRCFRLPAWPVNIVSTLLTFHAVVFSWIFFRAASISQAAQIVRTVFSAWWVGPWDFRVQGFGHAQLAVGLLCLAVLLVVEGLGGDDFRAMLVRRPRWQRWSFYYGFVLLIVNFGMFHSPQQFIYFQF